MRRIIAVLALAFGSLAFGLWLAGCAHKITGTTAAADPPHTTIFVVGKLDTVNHLVHLHWYGSSPHGYVTAYEVRLINPELPADTLWRYTTATDSAIAVYTPHGRTSPYFEARAIDDHGQRDPHPARQLFNFSNKPPFIQFVIKPAHTGVQDTTFASVTVTWAVTDSDGNSASARIHIWLDGQADSFIDTSGTTFTMPSERFKVNGDFAATMTQRKLYIQAIDDGGMAGNIDSVTWKVDAPKGPRDAQGRGRLLVISDTPASSANRTRSDQLYTAALTAAGLAPGTYNLMYLNANLGNQPFRSPADIAQTFGQFRNVIWYRGFVASGQTPYAYSIQDYQDGVGTYLDAGGHFYLESANMTSAWSSTGAFTLDFVQKYLAQDGVFLGGIAGVVNDSSAVWTVPAIGTAVLQSPWVAPPADSVNLTGSTGGLGGFKVRDLSQVVLLAPAGSSGQGNPFTLPLAVAVPQRNSGLFLANSVPIIGLARSDPNPTHFATWLQNVLTKFMAP